MRRAHVYPRVSEHIDDIIKTVQCLVDNGYGYVVDGDVFYSVENLNTMDSFPAVILRI